MVKTLDLNAFSLADCRVAVVVAEYNPHITESLSKAAVETLISGGVPTERILIVKVPGAWELPQAAQPLAAARHLDGIVCLGAVIKGETTHDQHLNRAISLRLCEMSSQYNVPIAMGVLMCNDVEQALQRSGGVMGNKGEEAAAAVLQMMRNLKAIQAWNRSLDHVGSER
ncbi:MAG: 6,7-dimethyl-8-ribityllumazine synthase [Planctomycetaceae bacterium]|nr:6,7-dimethyl-8-ribityllumazine synthase [Planctomycetaceae bacterium]